MTRISVYQYVCLLMFLTVPVATLEIPHKLVHSAYHNTWLVVVTALVPCYLLNLLYNYIIQNSQEPFPQMLDEHLGKILGKSLAVFYIVMFFLTSAYTLRLLVEFMKLNVLPATPVSVFVGAMLLGGFVGIKTGLNSIARLAEIIIPVGLVLTFLIVVIALYTNYQPERLLPLGNIKLSSLVLGSLNTTTIFAKCMPVLLLGFLLPQKQKTLVGLNVTVLLFISAITFISIILTITVGTIPSMAYVFPTFNMIRFARIGIFIQNLDIVFITVFITGFFGAIVIPWFMGCFVIQQICNLRDYRFLAAPSSLIIGVLSLLVCSNSLQVVDWSIKIIPFLYGGAYIVIPFLLFLVILFKTPRKSWAVNQTSINSGE